MAAFLDRTLTTSDNNSAIHTPNELSRVSVAEQPFVWVVDFGATAFDAKFTFGISDVVIITIRVAGEKL